MSTVGTMPIERILPGFQHSGSRDYIGRHRVHPSAPLSVRAARRVADEWAKERRWVTRLVDGVMDALDDTHIRNDLRRIGDVWRTMDRAAYGRLPKTWRHRIEASAKRRSDQQRQQKDTEAWWALRSADYPVLIPTQPLKIIEETRTR